MKKIVIIGVIIAAIVGLVALANFGAARPAETADAIYEASAETGYITEKVIGDPETAKVVIYEYADYACPHCADWNQTVNDLMKTYPGEIALVFRSYNIGFKNGPAAARAATAAQIQGYFKEYKDLLFKNQAEWLYESGAKLEATFCEYLERVSNGTADRDKFIEDMQSENVAKRLEFEHGMGKKVRLSGTPAFRINGKAVPLNELVETVEQLLNSTL